MPRICWQAQEITGSLIRCWWECNHKAPLANCLVSTKAIILPRWLSGKDYISVFNIKKKTVKNNSLDETYRISLSESHQTQERAQCVVPGMRLCGSRVLLAVNFTWVCYGFSQAEFVFELNFHFQQIRQDEK